MQLQITRPFNKQTFNIAWLEIITPVGNFIIHPEHAPTIVSLQPKSKITYCLENGKQETFEITNGFAHIMRNLIILLLTS